MKRITIEQFISAKTAYSRREILALIKKGSVYHNGHVVTSISLKINPVSDTIKIGKTAISGRLTFYYYKFHKPRDVITTFSDPNNRKDLSSFLEGYHESLFPVGRLDRNTTGLLILTNDGHFAHQISHPKFKLNKTYKVTLDKPFTKPHFQRLQTGIMLPDGPIVYTGATMISDSSLMLTLSEGRNRIIRKTFELLGYDVKKLHRDSIGPLELGTLPKGTLKPFNKSEISTFKKIGIAFS
ncbi:MAG: rRNA pseudouridine synthase [Candidatus Margulisbacteria bacterium]|nr:rRNA pseudouridine synthase [Candidatus Margulisiibacteriota bacterium]